MHLSGGISARGRRRGIARAVVVACVMGFFGASAGVGASATQPGRARAAAVPAFVARSLNGASNNSANPNWGKAGTNYTRVASAKYANGISNMVGGPNARYISDRIFNNVGQNLFSENNISQWGWAWGQFIDHDMGLRIETPAESVPVPCNSTDPLESFTNDTGSIAFNRTPAAPGTGVTAARQQVNTVSSYIDASNVYGGTAARLDWLRNGSLDGNPSNNSATLLMPNSYLPLVTARGHPNTAPAMFTAITGEAGDILGTGLTINDPHILDFIQLRNKNGNLIDPTSPGAQDNAVTGIRRTTLASRLRAIYGSVDKIDAIVGMVSEKHVPGTEFGELQLAIWKDQFQKVRDSDKFFYLNDKALPEIMSAYGVNFRHSLADILYLNTGVAVAKDVFHATP